MIIVDAAVITSDALVYSNVPENDAPGHDLNRVYATGDQVVAAHAIYQQAKGVSLTGVLTVGTPGRVNIANHNQVAGQALRLVVSAGGALPGGAAENTTYYIKSVFPGYFTISITPTGAELEFTGSVVGTVTVIFNDIGKDPVTQSNYWTKKEVTNRMKPFDGRNFTQAAMTDMLEYRFKMASICGGVILGNAEGNEVEIQVVDDIEGVVYQKTVSLILSNSGSSMFNWLFKRIQRKTSAIEVDLPPYYGATIIVRLKYPGATARLGVLMLGEVLTYDYTKWGVTATYKDFSTTTFDKDGVATTTDEPWATDMSVDLEIANDKLETMWNEMMRFRGRLIAVVGIKGMNITATIGRFVGLRVVIPHQFKSDVAMEFEGGV